MLSAEKYAELLRRARTEKLDIHKLCAAYMFGKDITQISNEERQRAKSMTFAIRYGHYDQ